MNRLLILYILLAVTVALDASASTLAAHYIFRLRQRFGWYLALAFTGVAIEGWVAIVTLGFSRAPQRIVGWIVTARILTRIFKATTMIALTLYLLGYLNGNRGSHTKG